MGHGKPTIAVSPSEDCVHSIFLFPILFFKCTRSSVGVWFLPMSFRVWGFFYIIFWKFFGRVLGFSVGLFF